MRKTKVKLKDINCVEMLRFQFFILQMLCGMQSVSIRQSQIKQNWTACIYIYLVIRKHIPPLIPRCSWEITFWQKKPRKCDHTLKLFQKWLKEQTLHFWLISRIIHSAHFLTTWSLEEGTRHLRALWAEIVASHNYTCENIVWFDFLWFASKNKNSNLFTMMYNCCFLLSFLFFSFCGTVVRSAESLPDNSN